MTPHLGCEWGGGSFFVLLGRSKGGRDIWKSWMSEDIWETQFSTWTIRYSLVSNRVQSFPLTGMQSCSPFSHFHDLSRSCPSEALQLWSGNGRFLPLSIWKIHSKFLCLKYSICFSKARGPASGMSEMVAVVVCHLPSESSVRSIPCL